MTYSEKGSGLIAILLSTAILAFIIVYFISQDTTSTTKTDTKNILEPLNEARDVVNIQNKQSDTINAELQ